MEKVGLPRDLAEDLRDELVGAVENRGGPRAPDELGDAYLAVVGAVREADEGDRVELPRETAEVAAEWLKAELDDYIERERERPPTGIDTYRRLEARLGDDVAAFPDTMLAGLDVERVFADLRQQAREES